MRISTFSPENFTELEKYWKPLEDGNDMTVFQQYDWYVNINQLYLNERFLNHFRECVYIVVLDGDKPVMIAPIQVIKVGVNIYYKNSIGQNRGFYLIGRNGYSDYLNFIYKDFSEQAAQMVFSYLKEHYHYKNCYFDIVLENTALYRYIHEHFRIQNNMKCYCAEIKLPETFEEYRKKLSKSTRQNIRTAFNRQKKNGIELHHELILETDEQLSEILYEIREKRLGKKQSAITDHLPFYGKAYYEFRRLYRKYLCSEHDVLKNNCNPWCFLVKDGDRIAGYFWGIHDIYKKVYYVILAGVEPDYAWYTPTVSHFYAFLEELYENGLNHEYAVFDFTRGGEKYKHDIGADEKDTYTIYFGI